MAEIEIILIFVAFIIVMILLCILLGYRAYKIQEKIKEKVNKLKDNSVEMSPQEFFEMRNTRISGNRKVALSMNFSGIYILHNTTKDMYYVGQGKEVLNRVNQHFTGKGNGDVYADYKYGDDFKISMIGLENSGFDTLNELERNAIMTYDAFNNGYNKTRGNRTL